MLELQIKRFENKEPRLKFSKMANLITGLKKELPWLCEVSIHSLQNICKILIPHTIGCSKEPQKDQNLKVNEKQNLASL